MHKIVMMIRFIILGEEFIGASRVLATLITYHILLHIDIEKNFIWLMPISVELEGQMWWQISVMHHPVGIGEFQFQEMGQLVVTDPWSSECMELFYLVVGQLKVQCGQCCHCSSQTVANNQNLGRGVHCQQFGHRGVYPIFNRLPCLKEPNMHLTLLTLIKRHQQKTNILEIILPLFSTPISIDNSPTLRLIAHKPNNLSFSIIDICNICEGRHIGALFTSPTLDFFTRAVSYCGVVGVADRLFFVVAASARADKEVQKENGRGYGHLHWSFQQINQIMIELINNINVQCIMDQRLQSLSCSEAGISWILASRNCRPLHKSVRIDLFI